jgi:hypothetical protein
MFARGLDRASDPLVVKERLHVNLEKLSIKEVEPILKDPGLVTHSVEA